MAVFILYYTVERMRLERALRRIPRRVAIAGTRGKSGVTRLIAGGLRASGARVLAKTTGSRPVIILPDGSEREITRFGPASIREQIRIVLLAARMGVDVFVAEMMSIGPEFLGVESKRILRPTTLAMTNVRLDHLEAMGRSKEDIARALASAVPDGADLFVPEEEIYPIFITTAARTSARLRAVVPSEADSCAGTLRPFPRAEHEPNIRLALAVCASLGVDREAARQGMEMTEPDFGGLRIWRGRFGDPPRAALCVSAFAANEPESSAAALKLAAGSTLPESRPLLGILSLREDRGDRTLQWVRAASEGFFREFLAVALIGPPALAALRRIRRTASPGPTIFFSAKRSSPEELMSRVLSFTPGEPLVVGLGNIVGPGERIVHYWDRMGAVHDF